MLSAAYPDLQPDVRLHLFEISKLSPSHSGARGLTTLSDCWNSLTVSAIVRVAQLPTTTMLQRSMNRFAACAPQFERPMRV